MKSITKCPHCETQFYVDDAQLSQYNGKVRCGNCLEVFVAADYFVTEQKQVPEVPQPTPEVIEEVTSEQTVEDGETTQVSFESNDPIDVSISNPAASFEFKQEYVGDEGENSNTSDDIEEELDGLTSVRDVDENFIAKTESLIKNIDIEDAATKLEPEANTTSIDELDKKKERKSFLDDAIESVDIQQPEFSFKIDSPETLDVLSKWREESDKEPELPEDPVEEVSAQEVKAPVVETGSIAEPPTPMTDEFVLPEPQPETQTKESLPEEATKDQYDFLMTEKEPLSPWMLALAIVLVLVLLGQGLYFFRNQIARAVPESKPLLQQLCMTIGCEISLPQEINLLSIDDSGIQQDATLQGVIRLSSTITNRAKFSQAYPKLEVTLTDERDMPKVRRVFSPSDYLKKQVNQAEGIQAGESIPVEMALMTDAENISGFRILLAY